MRSDVVTTQENVYFQFYTKNNVLKVYEFLV